MSLLTTIISGKQHAPRRLMLYGTHGIGKSTFASQAPKPVFIQTEDGLGEIDCDKFPIVTSFDDAMQLLGGLYAEDHPYQTVAIDSLDWLERHIWAEVCKRRHVGHIEDIGYGKGYSFALSHWRDFLDGLTALRDQRGMHVVLIAHAKIEKFENPETDSYDRYSPRLHRTASALIQEWCDEVLFASYRVHTRTTDEGFNRKRAQGIGTGERIIRTVERPAHVAKNRLALPEELPLAWDAYAAHLSNQH